MSRKKIIHLIHGLNTGGAETLVKDYLLNIDRQVFDVVLLCINREKESFYEQQIEKNKIKVVFVEDNIWVKGQKHIFFRVIRKIYKYLLIKKIIREENPDLVHTHLSVNNFVKFARLKKSTVIFHTVHNEPSVLWSKSKKGRKKDFKAAKWLVKHYGMRFIVLHDKMKKEVNKLFNVKNTVVLNNGIDLDKFRHAKDKKAMRNELEVPTDAFVIGHVGRFSEQKNHDFLINVFSEIKKVNNKAFLMLVGDGADKDKMIKKINELKLNKSCLILSNRSDVADLMSAMDVFVFPSLYEGLGIALIEAQESKLPCFVSEKIPEHATISNLVTCLSLDENAKKWADVILNYEKPQKIIVDDEDWDIKKITKKLEQLYIDALLESENGKK